MIEKILLSYLSNALDVPVFMEEPIDKPALYVVIEKTGSSCENRIKGATVALQSISSDSLLNAAELNEAVKDAMELFITNDSVAKSHLTTDYNFTDITTKRYRYQALYEVVYY